MRNILLVLLFTLLNIFWVVSDNTFPAIGDDARYLHETAVFSNVIATGNFELIGDKWQSMFIKDTTSVPRTPLFTLLSIPAFSVFGVNEDVAIITNVLVLGITSLLLGLFVQELFKHKAYNEDLATLSIVLFNLMPATYGLARLYMSEILQAFFVVLISYLYLKFKDRFSYKQMLILGVVWGLALLLRILMPIYLLVPSIFFIKWQLDLKKKGTEYIKALIVFLVPLILISATWYYPNFTTYINFVFNTSVGEIGSVTSMGPVFSPITWLKYWKVILTWHFGWPLFALFVIALIAFIIKMRTDGLKGLFKTRMVELLRENFLINHKKHIHNAKLFLFLSFIPALLMTTASDNKTARYFFPVEAFVIVLISYFIFKLFETKKIFLRILLMLSIVFISYPFFYSVIPYIPELPETNLVYTSNAYQMSDPDIETYEFVHTMIKDQNGSYYIIPETIGFNDAGLIWFSDLKGTKLSSLGEFSLYTTQEQGLQKFVEADIVILQSKVELEEEYMEKYEGMENIVFSDTGLEALGSKYTHESTTISIYIKKN